MIRIKIFIPFIFLAILVMPTLAAQEPIRAASSTSRPVKTPKQWDNTPLQFTFSLTPERSLTDKDTLPDAVFRQYNPARKKIIDWGSLGNLGSSARPLWFETRTRRGFDTGIHNFDLYKVAPDSLRFYRNARSLSDLSYSRGQVQDDGEFKARFARTFEGGLNISLDYRGINNLGQYRYQRVKHQALVVGAWLPIKKRYDGFLIYAKNTSKQQENGGVVDASKLGSGAFSGAIDLPVWLSDQNALSRHNDWDLQLTQHLKLIGTAKKDSTGKAIETNGRALRLTHTFTLGRQSFKFADADLENDTAFFGDFLVDERGLRNFIDLSKVENSFSLTTFKSKGNGERSDFISAGISHTYFNVYQEPERSKFSNVFLNGSAAFTPSERFSFLVRGDLGLLKNIGEYHVKGDLKLGLGAAGILQAGLLSQRFPPSLLQERLYVSFREVWKNDFKKPVETTIFGTYGLPLVGFEATVKTHLVNNFIYYNTSGRAEQTTAPVQVGQLLLRENLRLGHFHLDNTIGFQQLNSRAVLHLPKWFSKNSLYFSGNIVKKRLYTETGLDFRINSSFEPDSYQPLTWQFHLQDTFSQKPYPWVDVFAAFKIYNFRIFVRYENITGIWDKKNLFYQTNNYPQLLPAFRIGIRWRFLDGNKADNSDGNSGPSAPGGFSPGGRTPRF